MADRISPEHRSRLMSKIRGKDTSLERSVRSQLHREGYRFRKHIASLPGKPDVVFPREKVAVFIDGDFWHGWRLPAWKHSLPPFWAEKIENNRRRDRKNFRKLSRRGWCVVRVWGHEINDDLKAAVDRIKLAVQLRR